MIYDKLSNQIDSIVEKVGDFFTKIVPQALSNAGKAVVDVALNLKGNIDEKAQQIKDWFANKKDNIKELKASVTGKAVENINKIKSNWEDLKNKAKRKLSFKTSITDAVSSKLKTIKKLWDGFKTKTYTFSAKFIDSFSAPIKKAWNGIAKAINTATSKINSTFKTSIGQIYTFPGYALGGFPEDGWFRASHGEMIGRFDNGQSVVANNNQITEGISSAVQRGNQQMISYMQQEISELRTQNQLLTELLNKEFGISYSDVGKASQKYAREYTNRTGKPAYI